MIIAGPMGIGTGIYMAEKQERLFSSVVRFMADVLVGIPSIVLGLFGYITMVVGWAGIFRCSPARSRWRS